MKTYGPTMQCNSKTMDYIKCSKCLINDRLSLSVINSWAEVGYINKPQVWCCDEVWRLATKQLKGCAHRLCWCAVLLKLKLVLCSRLHTECEISFNRKLTEAYDCQKLSKSTKV